MKSSKIITLGEIKFLKSLDKKLRSSHEVDSDFYGTFPVDDYSGKKLNSKQLEKALEITNKRDNVVFHPINTCMGFSVGYQFLQVDILFPGVPPTIDLLLRFKEKQLPSEYDFESLSEYFMNEKNIQTANVAEIQIFNNYSSYEY